MIALFLLIFAFQNALAEEVNLRQLVNNLQMNMNEMSSKMTTFETKIQSLDHEIKVGVDLKNFESWTKNNFGKLRITPIKHLKSQNEYLESIVEMKEVEELVLLNQVIFVFFRYFYDRVDALENESNDGTEETKSVGAVSIEFNGESDQIWNDHFLEFNTVYCITMTNLFRLGWFNSISII